MVPEYVEHWGVTRGNTPGMDILTAGEEIVQKIGYRLWVLELGEGGTPVQHTYQLKNVYDCALPLCWGMEWVPVGCWKWIGGYCKQRASVSTSTSSQMWDSWYLPRFLFKGGSLTWWTLLLWWFWWSLVVPYPLWKSCLIWCFVLLSGSDWRWENGS